MSDYNWGKAHTEATTILEGDFPVIITEASAIKNNAGKSQLALKLKITAGPQANRTLTDKITFSPESPGALRMFFISMNQLGLNDAFFATLTPGDAGFAQIAVALQGKEATAILVKSEWPQGTFREKIQGYKGAGQAFGPLGVAALPLPVALPVALPEPVPPASAPPVFTSGDDELPF